MVRATAALAPNPLRRICALWTPVLRLKFWLLTDALSQDALSFQGDEQYDNYPDEQQSKPFGPSTDAFSQVPLSFQGDERYDNEPEGGRSKPLCPTTDAFSHDLLSFQGDKRYDDELEEERSKPCRPITEQRRCPSRACVPVEL